MTKRKRQKTIQSPKERRQYNDQMKKTEDNTMTKRKRQKTEDNTMTKRRRQRTIQ
jgi:hypothetical protein